MPSGISGSSIFERMRTNAPPSIRSNVTRPRRVRPGRYGCSPVTFQTPTARSSTESARFVHMVDAVYHGAVVARCLQGPEVFRESFQVEWLAKAKVKGDEPGVPLQSVEGPPRAMRRSTGRKAGYRTYRQQ